MKEQLLETWDINNRMNLLLIDAITDKGMECTTSTRGGRTVYLQWVHIHNVRVQWLEICAKDLFLGSAVLDKSSPPDRKKLRAAFEDSGKRIRGILDRGYDNNGKLKGFKKGLVPFLGYFISHESHHRGNILLTLKLCGEKIPDAVKWNLWEWNK
jgi:uncharacterized damage-inducible protein DinB